LLGVKEQRASGLPPKPERGQNKTPTEKGSRRASDARSSDQRANRRL